VQKHRKSGRFTAWNCNEAVSTPWRSLCARCPLSIYANPRAVRIETVACDWSRNNLISELQSQRRLADGGPRLRGCHAKSVLSARLSPQSRGCPGQRAACEHCPRLALPRARFDPSTTPRVPCTLPRPAIFDAGRSEYPFLLIYSSSGGSDQIAVPDTALASISMKT